jgi:hypothetical protein
MDINTDDATLVPPTDPNTNDIHRNPNDPHCPPSPEKINFFAACHPRTTDDATNSPPDPDPRPVPDPDPAQSPTPTPTAAPTPTPTPTQSRPPQPTDRLARPHPRALPRPPLPTPSPQNPVPFRVRPAGLPCALMYL